MKNVVGLLGAGCIVTVMLTGCSALNSEDDPAASVAIAPSTSSAPTFQPKETQPIIVKDLSDEVVDTGLNIKVQLQAAGYNPEGSGSVIYVLVTNLNDVPLPPDAITVTLRGATLEEDGTIGLDLPLGAGASTNLQYAFDVSTSALYDARFTIGNLVFEGNLAGV